MVSSGLVALPRLLPLQYFLSNAVVWDKTQPECTGRCELELALQTFTSSRLATTVSVFWFLSRTRSVSFLFPFIICSLFLNPVCFGFKRVPELTPLIGRELPFCECCERVKNKGSVRFLPSFGSLSIIKVRLRREFRPKCKVVHLVPSVPNPSSKTPALMTARREIVHSFWANQNQMNPISFHLIYAAISGIISFVCLLPTPVESDKNSFHNRVRMSNKEN